MSITDALGNGGSITLKGFRFTLRKLGPFDVKLCRDYLKEQQEKPLDDLLESEAWSKMPEAVQVDLAGRAYDRQTRIEGFDDPGSLGLDSFMGVLFFFHRATVKTHGDEWPLERIISEFFGDEDSDDEDGEGLDGDEMEKLALKLNSLMAGKKELGKNSSGRGPKKPAQRKTAAEKKADKKKRQTKRRSRKT